MEITVLQHVPFEGPGLVGTVARERGHDVRVVRLFDDEPVPEVVGLSALVVLGGPMGVMDDKDLPTAAAERDLMASATRAGLPVLGVCLGAQLLAASAGAPVHRGPAPEVGLGHVSLTRDGRADPVLGPAALRLSVLHWHSDTYELPGGAVRLASSELYPEQAFRLGPRAYGLQFHVEVDAEWVDGARDRLPPALELDPRRLADVEVEGRAVLSRWLRLAETA